MNKSISLLSLILLGFAGSALKAAPPERADSRVDVSRLATDESRTYRGDGRTDEWDRRGGRAAEDVARLNREVRQVRMLIGESSMVGKRIRDRFHRVLDATEYLNAQLRRGKMRGDEIHRGSDAIRADLDWVRRELREQRRGHHGGR